MPLSVYLDDCGKSNLLAEFLQGAGQTMVRPTDPDVTLEGADDAVHFAYAVRNSVTIITKNPADFLALQRDADPHHPGSLGVYQDNDVSRDMSDAEIVRAIANIEAAVQSGGDPVLGHFHVLNDWRY